MVAMTDDEIYGHLDFVVARPSIDEIRQGNFWRFDLVAILVSTRGLGVLEGKTEVDSQSFRTMVWPLLVGPNMPILMNADEDSDDDGG